MNTMPEQINDYDDFMEETDQIYDLLQIERALSDIALKIEEDYAATLPLCIVVMNGGLIAAGHLLPKLSILLDIDYCHATRYENTTQGRELQWLNYPQQNLQDRDIILIDDIFDEGVTLKQVADYCHEQGAKTVSSIVLLDKKHDRKVDAFVPDYIALTVPDRYVFGFGLDINGRYRNAPGIFALAEEND